MRRVGPAVLLLFLALTVLLDCPGRLWASEGGGGGADFLVLRVDLTFWTIVVFGVLLLVLRKFAWGPILEGLQKREQAIQNAIDECMRPGPRPSGSRINFRENWIVPTRRSATFWSRDGATLSKLPTP